MKQNVCGTSSSPQKGFNRVPRGQMGALGLRKSSSSWCWSPLETSCISERHFDLLKLLYRFCFLQQSQLTGASTHLLSAASAVPSGGRWAGSHRAQEEPLLQAQPLNSVTFREPHTYFKDLLFALESSSEMTSLHPLNSNIYWLGAAGLPVARRENWTWTLHQVAWVLGW